MDNTAFGALIRQKRGARRLTQDKLADIVFGDSGRKGDISRIENGRVTPQEATVQKLCTALDISDAEMLAIRQSRPSAAHLEQIPTLSREELQNLAARFQIADAFDQPDNALREILTQKAKEYRSYRATIDALDDRVAAIANLKGAAQDAAAKLDFDEVEALLSRVDEVETEIAAETKVARARNALLRNDPETAFRLLSAAADGFASSDLLEPVRRRVSYQETLLSHGINYPGPSLELAVKMNRNALAHVDRETDPVLWATVFDTLGRALGQVGTRSASTEVLQDAVTAYSAALEVRTREATPMQWAMTQNNLATALADLGSRTGDTEALGDAVTAFRAALEVYTQKASPMQWAMTQNNLGNALQTLGDRAGDTDALQDAFTAYRAALEVRTREATPMQWAMTQNNLGNALRILGARAGDTQALQDAVTAFRAALEVHTREAAPFPHAETMGNLAIVYCAHAALSNAQDRATDLATALDAVDTALDIYTPEHTPYHHDKATRLRELILAAMADAP